MNTPIFDFVARYAASETARFHMPGHKGKCFLGCEPLDITEIDGADVLYSADGIIDESEQNATALFDTAHSYYSTEGSSLCIKAMLGLVAQSRKREGRPLILAARNVHKAFVYACALLDLDVEWLLSKDEEHLCSCTVTAADVEAFLQCRTPTAVYLTSPDYLGQVADIASISRVCRQYGVPLLVDNAHGAYLQFLTPSQHPIALGATLCCDSAHKTLPVLTGGAYLHISKDADPAYLQSARGMLSMFASTSPSYLILQSLDLCNRYLASNYRGRLEHCIQVLNGIKKTLSERGFVIDATEPLKLVINTQASGLYGNALAHLLHDRRVEVEFADRDRLVLMVTPETDASDYEKLLSALSDVEPKAARSNEGGTVTVYDVARVCTIREAIFAPHEVIPTAEALGRICASPTVSCPPAVPVVVSGERITEEALRLLLYYRVDHVEVVVE